MSTGAEQACGDHGDALFDAQPEALENALYDEVVECLTDYVLIFCGTDDDALVSRGREVNATALRLLARLGRVEITYVYGNDVKARWLT